MAMLRVSSYRKLFEDAYWSGNGGSSVQCAGLSRASTRGVTTDDCDCDKLDFVSAKALNKESLGRFVQDRAIISALNDRLVRLIELGRCLEVENESLESQIVELEDRLKSQQTSAAITTTLAVPDYSLVAVLNRLRKERDETLCDSVKLKTELERLKQEYEKVAKQRTLIQFQHQDFAVEVDMMTAECLALREQVAIYEEQLANMEAQHETAVDGLSELAAGTAGAVAAIEFCSPDITEALDIKDYYCQLAESLQYKCSVSFSAAIPTGDGAVLAVGSKVNDLSKITDISELKKLIAQLEKELTELEKKNEELEDEVEMKRAEYLEEIEELECTLEKMRHQQAELQAQMKEQCLDHKKLLNEKMARSIEIAAYRGLVEEEEERLCSL